jgi:hypothetical protein
MYMWGERHICSDTQARQTSSLTHTHTNTHTHTYLGARHVHGEDLESVWVRVYEPEHGYVERGLEFFEEEARGDVGLCVCVCV